MPPSYTPSQHTCYVTTFDVVIRCGSYLGPRRMRANRLSQGPASVGGQGRTHILKFSASADCQSSAAHSNGYIDGSLAALASCRTNLSGNRWWVCERPSLPSLFRESSSAKILEMDQPRHLRQQERYAGIFLPCATQVIPACRAYLVAQCVSAVQPARQSVYSAIAPNRSPTAAENSGGCLRL